VGCSRARKRFGAFGEKSTRRAIARVT